MAPPSRPTAIRPFRGLHYDPRRVDVRTVVAPPYDVIDAAGREELLRRSPHNVVRLILPEAGEEANARRILRDWREAGVLVEDAEPCLYWTEQDFVGPDGVRRTRGGLVALVRLEPYEAGVIRPHERTHAGPKEGRLRLLRATRAQLSPVFALYRDPERRVERVLGDRRAAEPDVDVADEDGTRHRLWRVAGGAGEVAAALADRPLLIADGHHRYETALAYREEQGATGDDHAAAWTMAYLANAASDGLQIFPTHRLASGLDPARVARLPEALPRAGFRVDPRPGADADALVAALAAAGDRPAMALAGPALDAPVVAVLEDEGPLRALLPDAVPALRGLDVTAFDVLVRGPLLGLGDHAADEGLLRYGHRAARVVAGADRPDRLAVLLRAPGVEEVEAVADAGAVMPQKSTYFYPKTIDGLVFYRLDGSDDG